MHTCTFQTFAGLLLHEKNRQYATKTKQNWPAYLHGYVKVRGLSVFSFDEHFLGGINQEDQTVSPCDLVIS